MQPEQQSKQGQAPQKDPHAAALGRRGGQKRMAKLSAKERSALSRHAAQSRWHPLETRLRKERAEEIALVIKQAIDGYLPRH